MKWDGLLMHSNGGDVGMLHGGGKCQTETIHHGTIKRPAAPKWVRGVRHLCWTTEFLCERGNV